MMTTTLFLVEGQAVWRKSKNQFCFLLILGQQSINNYPAPKQVQRSQMSTKSFILIINTQHTFC